MSTLDLPELSKKAIALIKTLMRDKDEDALTVAESLGITREEFRILLQEIEEYDRAFESAEHEFSPGRTMDSAERWLRENDPNYRESRKTWRHVKGAIYVKPGREVLLSELISAGSASATSIDPIRTDRTCHPVGVPKGRSCPAR